MRASGFWSLNTNMQMKAAFWIMNWGSGWIQKDECAGCVMGLQNMHKLRFSGEINLKNK